MKHARKDYDENIQAPTSMIPADEPVFLLRGQDKYASRAVRYWAALVASDGGGDNIVEAAVKIADDMDAWPVKKVPDMPEGS